MQNKYSYNIITSRPSGLQFTS